ncbi:MAG: hypothetical protein ABDH59_08680, partial [Fervidobacterium sp.]
YLKVKPGKEYFSSHKFFLSISPTYLCSFAEFRTDWARQVIWDEGNALPLAFVTQSDSACGLYLRDRNTLLLTTHFNCDPVLFKMILSLMGVEPKCEVIVEYEDAETVVGVYPFLLSNDSQYLLIMNIEPIDKRVTVKLSNVVINNIEIPKNGVKLIKL